MPHKLTTIVFLAALAAPACASPYFFSTGDPDGRMASASRPDTASFEIESADDFAVTLPTAINKATFTGLIPTGSSVQQVVIEIYRVFPNDSDTGRTSGAPNFSTSQVPTRVNSPSDVAFASRDSAASQLSFSTSILSASFTASNSVQPGGIHPAPNFHTGGNGAVTGEEVEFSVAFMTPIDLAADHYFFIPQVLLNSGDFLWLSAPKPIVPPGTPFPSGVPDLQSWTRDAMLDPDWLRIGTDIDGFAGPYNAAFSLSGDTSVPEPASMALFGAALFGLRRRKR